MRCLLEESLRSWRRGGKGALHLAQDVVRARLEGYVEELAHLGQLGTSPHQALCKVPEKAKQRDSGCIIRSLNQS